MKLGVIGMCALSAMAIAFGLVFVSSCSEDDAEDGDALGSFCEKYVDYLYRCNLPNLDQMGRPLDEAEGVARCEEKYAEQSNAWLYCTSNCINDDNLCYGDCTSECDNELEFEETWKDGETALVWQVNAQVKLYWEEVESYCADLELGGHDDWRLPTINELRSLIRGCPTTVTGGECKVSDSCTQQSECENSACEMCVSWEGTHPWDYYLPKAINPYLPDGDNDCDIVWSATAATLDDNEDEFRWVVDFIDGRVTYDTAVYAEDCVRCVRGGE